MPARRPNASRVTTALPSLRTVTAHLLAGSFGMMTSVAHAQQRAEVEGGIRSVSAHHAAVTDAGDDASEGDAGDAAVNDASDVPLPPIIVETHTLGGVPMRTGGAPPSHGMCACDIPHAPNGASMHAAALGVAAMLVSARRRRR